MKREDAELLLMYYSMKLDKMKFVWKEYGGNSIYYIEAIKEFEAVRAELIEKLTNVSEA